MTNSRKRPSTITFGGSAARVQAPEVGSVGLIGNASNWVTGTKLMPYQSKLPDPFASVPEASTYIPSSCSPALVVEGGQWNNRNLSEGCWTGLSIKREIVLNAGTYVVNGGTLEFAANANVTATGPVTFILTGPNSSSIAKLVITSTAVINLSAPTTGPLKDLLFYQDRRARYLDNENTMVGTASSVFNGSLYFPGSNLAFTGNSSSTGICMKIVALRMSFTGNSAANLTCPASARGGMFGHTVRLVA
jgi:hypothetical protein